MNLIAKACSFALFIANRVVSMFVFIFRQKMVAVLVIVSLSYDNFKFSENLLLTVMSFLSRDNSEFSEILLMDFISCDTFKSTIRMLTVSII